MEEILQRVMAQAGSSSSSRQNGKGPEAWLDADSDDEEIEENDDVVEDEELWRRIQQQEQQQAAAQSQAPRYTENMAALVSEYAYGIQQGAWAQAKDCLDRLLVISSSSSSSSSSSLLYALQDVATGLLTCLRQREPRGGWDVVVVTPQEQHQQGKLMIKGYGGASASPAALEEQVLAPLRHAVRQAWQKLAGEKKSMEFMSEGAALVLALLMEAAKQEEDKEEEEGEKHSFLEQQALALMTHTPCLLSLHCCALGLRRLLSLLPPSNTDPPSPMLLDLVLMALTHLEPTWDVDSTLTKLTSSSSSSSFSFSGSLGGLQEWQLQFPSDSNAGIDAAASVAVLPAELTTSTKILPLIGHDDANLMEVAQGMWKTFINASTSFSSSSSNTSNVMLPLLTRLRQAWGQARAQHQERALAPRVGRTLLALLRSQQIATIGQIDGEILGNILPLSFALIEEYEREEHMILGYLIWCFAAHKTTPTELSWHLPIQLQVFQRCLKVITRKAGPLRLLLFATTELLRLTGGAAGTGTGGGIHTQTQTKLEVERAKQVIMEELLAGLARAPPTEHSIVFVFLEGLYHLLCLYKGTYLLVRYLRPLTQVLILAPLEEGDDAVRLMALRTLLVVLEQCDVMLHQHAIETLAQVIRLYLLLARRGKKQVANDVVMMKLCQEVGRVLRKGVGKKKEKMRAEMEAFVQVLIREGGCVELEEFWG